MTTSLRLPSAAIRRIVKLNTEVSGMNAEGVVLLSKLTEEVLLLVLCPFRKNKV